MPHSDQVDSTGPSIIYLRNQFLIHLLFSDLRYLLEKVVLGRSLGGVGNLQISQAEKPDNKTAFFKAKSTHLNETWGLRRRKEVGMLPAVGTAAAGWSLSALVAPTPGRR